jgi:Na+-driven multidrug efflux pump
MLHQTTSSTAEPLLESGLISFKDATKEAAYFAVPFALSRLAAAGQSFGNGIVIAHLDVSDITAAAPIMFMTQQCFIGTAKGALSSVNTIISNLNGQKKFNQIGSAVNQGLLLGTFIGVPTMIIFFTAQDWLPFLSMNKNIAKVAGEYLRSVSYSILPAYWSFVDQSFLLSIKRSLSPIMLNTLLVGASMAIGYPLAIINNNIAGLGYGVSIASMLTFIVGRYHLYTNQTEGVLDREQYNLFSKSFDSGTSFINLFRLSFPTSLQALSEWLPTMLITLLSSSGKNADEVLEAEEPSMQMLIALNQILLGLGTATTISVANALGRAHCHTEEEQLELAILWKKNARTIGYAELTVTSAVMLPLTLFCAIYPHPIVQIFSKRGQNYPLAESMLRVTGITLIIDGIRNTITGALLGRKKSADNFFTSITNLLITGATATTLGYFSQDIVGPLSFFLCRMIGIFITAYLLMNRWEQRSRVVEPVAYMNNCSHFWHKISGKSRIVENLIIEEKSTPFSLPTLMQNGNSSNEI